LIQRKSVRKFLPKAVDSQLIRQILEYARFSPSGTNTQPWQVAVISGKAKAELEHLLTEAFRNGIEKKLDYTYYPSKLPRDMQLRRVKCGMQMYQAVGISRDDMDKRLQQWEQNYSAFGAPVMLLFFTNQQVEKGSYLDCGMFIQSVLLMANELGLASCAQAALAEYPQIVRDYLGYSQEHILLCGMAIGYEDPSANINNYRTTREEVDNFTRFFD
ncbi:MAG: hypothetical protein RLZZ293_70, partial [Pseudomonadota bacterium]